MVFNILLQVKKMIENISKQNQLRDSETCELVDGLKQTTGPLDLFKILNETFENYKRCSYKEVAEKMLVILKREITYYQNYLEILLVRIFIFLPLNFKKKDQKFTVEKYIGLSNDTLSYIKNINDFSAYATEITGLPEEEVEKVITILGKNN